MKVRADEHCCAVCPDLRVAFSDGNLCLSIRHVEDQEAFLSTAGQCEPELRVLQEIYGSAGCLLPGDICVLNLRMQNLPCRKQTVSSRAEEAVFYIKHVSLGAYRIAE